MGWGVGLVALGSVAGVVGALLVVDSPGDVAASRAAPVLGAVGARVELVALGVGGEASCLPDGGSVFVPFPGGFGEGVPVVVSGAPRSEGDEVVTGTPLVEVSGRMVVAVQTTIPLFRDVTVGIEGQDVLAVEEGLVAQGVLRHADTVFDAGARSALDEALANQDGPVGVVLGPGNTVPVPVGARFEEYVVGLGQSPEADDAGDVLSVTTGEAGYSCVAPKGIGVAAGDEVQVTDGVTSGDAVVTGVAASASDDHSQEVQLRVETKELVGVGALTAQFRPVQEPREVLAVPVGALWSTTSGGAGVQLAEDGSGQPVPVQVGVVQDGWAEISGEGVVEGAKVEINTTTRGGIPAPPHVDIPDIVDGRDGSDGDTGDMGADSSANPGNDTAGNGAAADHADAAEETDDTDSTGTGDTGDGDTEGVAGEQIP